MSEEVTEQTGLGEVYLLGLMRAQLRLALRVLFVGAAGLGVLPAVFATIPESRELLVQGIPLPWLTLGVLVYPAAMLGTRYYVRASERLETAFVDVTTRT